MNFHDEQAIKQEEKKIKLKIWIYTLIIFVSVGGVAWFIFSIYLSFKTLGEDLSKNTYHILELTDDNREKIISILEREDIDYCKSIYKIEWFHRFPHGTPITIYCKDTDNIRFNVSESELIKYIDVNGTTERR